MNCLLYAWDAYGEQNLLMGLTDAGFPVEEYRRHIKNHINDVAFQEDLDRIIREKHIELVISFNYFPLISDVCDTLNTPYFSWIFSSPHYSLYCDNVFHKINYIFCFDKIQYMELKNYGLPHIYHLPLAAGNGMLKRGQNDTSGIGRSKVSFVGTLYTDERNYFDQIPHIPDYMRGYLEGICEAQLKIYGYSMLKDVLTKQMVQTMKEFVDFKMDDNYFLSFEQFLEDTLNKKITIMERSRILTAISQKMELDLYTGSDCSHIPLANHKGYIHYYNQMPVVFSKSDINVNITLRSIASGIPLRVVDILSCKGFLLTNYQEEIAEYYADGEEVVMFGSMEEAVDKCRFYLKNEKRRIKIAENGYLKATSEYSYEAQLKKMFTVL